MILASDTTLGLYEIVAPLGAGGMGEVHRAQDRKLDSDGALKILPDSLARDPERMVEEVMWYPDSIPIQAMSS